MSDLISRKGVFIPDITVEMLRNASLEGVEDLMASGEMEDISLPSAQPERKRGEWIDYTEDGYVECPFCHSATNCDGDKDELHFCFSCGADMRGEEE